jgi:hypothetical protein
MVRSIIEDHRKEIIDREKNRDMEHQLSIQRYKDFSTKLLTILGSSDGLSNHIPGNFHGTDQTHNADINFIGNGNDNTQQTINTPNLTLPIVNNNVAIRVNNQPTPYDRTNQFNPDTILNQTSNIHSKSSFFVPLV